MALNFDITPIKGSPAEKWADADKGEVFEELDEKFLPDNSRGDWKSSMSQDVTKGRRTEIDFMNGYIADRGKELGIETPVNAAITSVVSEIDRGIRTPGISNIQEVLKRAQVN